LISKVRRFIRTAHIITMKIKELKVRQRQEGRTDRLEDKLHLFVLFVLILDIAGAEHKLGTVIVLLCRGIVLENLFRRVAGSITTTKLS